MKHVFIGQTKLRLTLMTQTDLSGYIEAHIKYRKPSGKEGYFTGTVPEPAVGNIIYDITENDSLDEEGFWIFWPEVFFFDDTKAFGRSQSVYIFPEGK